MGKADSPVSHSANSVHSVRISRRQFFDQFGRVTAGVGAGLWLPRHALGQDVAPTRRLSTQTGVFIPAPILWWKLNEGTGTTVADSSGNGYTGTSDGNGSSNWRFLAAPYASVECLDVALNVGRCITSSNVSQIGGVANASICGWFDLAGSTTGMQMGWANSTSYQFNVASDVSGRQFCQVSNGSQQTPYWSIPSGQHFYCMTFDGTQATATNRVVIYSDAVPQALTASGSGNPTTTATAANLGNFIVGQWVSQSNDNSPNVADVRVFNSTLTQAQISALYAAGPADKICLVKKLLILCVLCGLGVRLLALHLYGIRNVTLAWP